LGIARFPLAWRGSVTGDRWDMLPEDAGAPPKIVSCGTVPPRAAGCDSDP